MKQPKFNIGDEVYVRDPGRYIKGVRSLIGFVEEIIPIGDSFKYRFHVGSATGEVFISTGPGQSDFVRHVLKKPVEIFESDLGDRSGGYRLSELDGRNGGNAAWRALSSSWGY